LTDPQQTILTAAIAIAREAGELIRQMTPRKREIDFKGVRDMVTEVDHASESLIRKRVAAQFPEHRILAEESGGRGTASDTIWIIDPLDGTTNFVHGFPMYAVSIGVAHGAALIAGVVYDPVRDECFSARRGGGAWLNERPIHVSATADLGHSLLATGFPYSNNAPYQLNMDLWQQIYGKTQGLRRAGSAALDLSYLAAGRLDGFWEFMLEPWDQAAGGLIVQEADGYITRLDGTPWQVGDRQILAANPDIHAALLTEFEPHIERIRDVV